MDEISSALNERFLLQQEYLGTNKEVNKTIPVVSVCVATYQHGNYIKECLDGILMQKTNFPIEVIIGEDGSIDKTQDICKEYAEKHPDRIRLFLRDRKLSQFINSQNKTVRFNGIWNRMSARGKYIAICEGDDYWIDPLKLQKQVDFLEANEDYGLVCTDVNYYYQTKDKFEYSFFKTRKYNIQYTFDDFLVKAWFVATCTWVFRKDLLMLCPKNQNFNVGDLPLILSISLNSKIKYLNEVTTVYRVLDESACHIKDFQQQLIYQEGILNIQLYFMEASNKQSLKSIIMKNYYLNLTKVSFAHRNVNAFVEYLGTWISPGNKFVMFLLKNKLSTLVIRLLFYCFYDIYIYCRKNK